MVYAFLRFYKMNTHADKTQQSRSQSVAGEKAQQRNDGEATFQFVDNRPETVTQKKLQEMTNYSPQAQRLNAFQELANTALHDKSIHPIQKKSVGAFPYTGPQHGIEAQERRDSSGDRNLTIQRYPVSLDELNDDDQNPGVYTDSKHDWMRMIFRGDLGRDTFELLHLNGAPSGSFMIYQREYDQYRFSMDGREISDRFPPHFMEELNGDARIADDIENPLKSYAGEYGVGFRPAEGVSATVEMSGMISCIGFILKSESAVFACHMVVTNGVPQKKGPMRDQVNALVARFEHFAGEAPEYCELLYDVSTYGGQPDWLEWMKPDGVDSYCNPAREVKETVVGHMDEQPTVMWRGDPLRY